MGWLTTEAWNAIPQLARFDEAEQESIIRAVAEHAGAAAIVRVTLSSLCVGFVAGLMWLTVSAALLLTLLAWAITRLLPELIGMGFGNLVYIVVLFVCAMMSLYVGVRAGQSITNRWYRDQIDVWMREPRCWACRYLLKGLAPSEDGSLACPECGRVHARWQTSLTPEDVLPTEAVTDTARRTSGDAGPAELAK